MVREQGGSIDTILYSFFFPSDTTRIAIGTTITISTMAMVKSHSHIVIGLDGPQRPAHP
jgi:hypothetical protein